VTDIQHTPVRPRILIVDDDVTMRLLMYEALSEDGYKIDEVDNGPAAIEAIKASEPDMVLLDVKMPGMSGFEVCSEIRRLTGDIKISVVMVTGLDDSASIEKAFQLGATAFISKPINWDTFPYRIQYLLKARNAIVTLKQRELSLQHTERISRVLTQSKNKDTLLKGILHEMLDIFSADRAFIITSLDNEYTKLDVVAEALRGNCMSVDDSRGTLAEDIGKENLHWSNTNEHPLVSSRDDESPSCGFITYGQVHHQILKALHVHNDHSWFLILHKCANTRPWSASEQETLYISCLRLRGVLSRYLLTEKLHHSEYLLRQAQRIGHIGNWRWNAKTGQLSWSDELYQIYGYEPGSFIPSYDHFYHAVAEDDYERLKRFKQAVFSSANTHSIEHRIILPDGKTRWVYQQAAGTLDSAGNLTEVNGIVQDITERIKKQAQEAHNHKMEAIGQLTSGVAHDFGNLMTIAKGNLELLNESLVEHYAISDADMEILSDAYSAVQDSVDLTRQLLAFSRKKSLEQEFLNVKKAIKKFGKLFKNTLGNNIELSIQPEKGLPDILVDTTRFESSLLNILINARNAMPDGGKITIKSELIKGPPPQGIPGTDKNATGQFVCISIKDTGIGMTDEVRQHATEPFFTTSKNEGTGLGLSMVYGFMRQSGGELKIDSTPGKGTCLKMLFPVYRGKRAHQEEITKQMPVPAGKATILVVEDRPDVRQFAIRCLNTLKLDILEAEDAASAMHQLENNSDIDILFTDILMPGDMNGRDLANWATDRYPQLKVILTTAAEKEGQQMQPTKDHSFQLLLKPYSKHDLMKRICDILQSA
jgi:PAS domain S-box-containing protein